MDSWKYLSEGRGVCLNEEFDFTFDGHGCKSKVMGCELKPFPNVETFPLVSNAQALERWDFMDLGFSDEIRKSYSISSEPSGEVFSDEIGNEYGNEGKDSGSRISDFRQSNNQDSLLVDLKLGRLSDGGVIRDGDFSKVGVPEASTELSPSGKRARSMSLYSRSSTCQVLGCDKDLSSYKGYYKRHKVCDVHTRTAKVIVQGIEQRFCQQCSRFHQLTEFDDGKRSCRRRLAAHNNRRRKPRCTSEPGAGIIDFSSSHAFPRVLSSATVGPSRYEEGKLVEDVKCEDSIEGSDFFLHISGVGGRNYNTPAEVKGSIVGTASPTILNLSSVQQNSRALSLLSDQSHNVSSQLLQTTVSSMLINKSSHADINPEHALNNSAGSFKRMGQSGCHAPGMYPTEADNVEPTMIKHSDGNTFDLRTPGVGSSTEPNSRYTPLGRGIILDLLQLSSHLKRIEQQRHSTESEAE